MHVTNLRKVGGSVMLAVPPALLDVLNLKAGAEVGVSTDGEKLIVRASSIRKYSLAELLARSDYSQKSASIENEWVNGQPIGEELI